MQNKKKSFLTLAFNNSKLEVSYRENCFHKFLLQIRIALILGAILYSFFAFADNWFAYKSKYQLWSIRFSVSLFIFIIFGITFSSFFKKYWRFLVSLAGFIGGIGLIGMLLFTNEQGSFLYPSGLLLVIMWIYIFSGLGFIYSSITSLAIFTTYCTVALLITNTPLYIYTNNVTFIIRGIFIGSFAGYIIENYSRTDFVKNIIIDEEREEIERLLRNILPQSIADELKRNQGIIANKFNAITILFADIVGFTSLSAKISPDELIIFLNEIFSIFDRLVDQYGLEKIKTIGDAYMVAGGLPIPRNDHAEATANFALELQQEIKDFRTKSNQAFDLRIGIHTGPAIAGVIGVKKFIYDIWGDSVNTASRMESHSIPGKIQVSEETFKLLKNKFIFKERGIIKVKGKGEVKTYFLQGRQ